MGEIYEDQVMKLAPTTFVAGAKIIFVHGRTRKQGYSGACNLEYIKRAKSVAKNIKVFGNGNLLAALDKQNMLCDLYFPYVGMEGQIAYKHKHRIGVFVDNQFSWLYNENWKHKISYFMESLVSNSSAINKNLNLELRFNDFVYPSEDAFIRKIVVKNNADYNREVKLFFSQDFHLYGDNQQDTTFYEPNSKAVVHYRKKRYFLIGGLSDHIGVDSYSTGKSEYNGLEGVISLEDVIEEILNQEIMDESDKTADLQKLARDKNK
jgi:hypothetical protein